MPEIKPKQSSLFQTVITWDLRQERLSKGEYDNFWLAFGIAAIISFFGITVIGVVLKNNPILQTFLIIANEIVAVWRFYSLRRTNQNDID